MLSCLVFIFFQGFDDLTNILGAFFDELHAAKICLRNGVGIPPTLEIKVREPTHGLPQGVFRSVLRWSP
jgi:hypothetical protein